MLKSRQKDTIIMNTDYLIESFGEIPEWSKGADCKSASSAFVGSNPTLATILRFPGPFGLVRFGWYAWLQRLQVIKIMTSVVSKGLRQVLAIRQGSF